jgi:D-glycero-D-manno-heptose 1,7-bisphosphate phosphatase
MKARRPLSNVWWRMSSNRKRAAFLDRDGTIIVEREYLADPAGVQLVDGALDALRELHGAGYELIVVTNQSGIARGLYSEAEFHAVQQRLEEILVAQGIHFAGVYYCPHHPDFTGPCDCRKPDPGMYLQASREHDIDLGRSVYIGDRIKDVAAAARFGGLGILVRTGYGADESAGRAATVSSVSGLLEAARLAASWTASP